MKHKALAIVLAICMVLSMLPVTAFAAPVQRTARIEAQPQIREELQALPELPADTTAGKYSISAKVVKGSSHGEIELSATSADAREAVYLLANPDDGYLVEFGGKYNYTYYDMAITYIGMDIYEITMPDGDVNLEVKFVAAEGSSHKINASVNNADWGTMNVSRTSAKAGESVYVEISPKVTYTLEELSVSDANGNGVYGGYMGSFDGVEVYELIMPDSALTITAKFTRSAQHSITWGVSPAAAGSVTLSHTKAYTGETVTATFHANPGYTLVSRSCSANQIISSEGNTFTFIMPDYDVVVTGKYESYFSKVSVVVDTGLGGSAVLDKDQGKPGDTVTLTCTPEEGYRVAQVTGVDNIVDNGDGSYTFPMPGGVDVVIHVLFLRNENPFLDVTENQFFYDSVLWAVENGITKGINDTHFGPKELCSRAHAVTFLWRAAGSPEPTITENPFTDVSSGRFYSKAVLWAVENGITTGVSATSFDPDGVCTRAHVVTFLWRAKGCPDAASTSHPFVDVNERGFYYKALLWAVENGITKGIDATHFQPSSDCQRGQVVTFLYRADGIPMSYDLHWVINGFQDTPSDYGTVTLSHTKAQAGETITATAIPAEGYVLDWAKCEFGTPVTQVSDTEFTFVMPEHEEVFHVNFSEVPVEPEPTEPEPTEPTEPAEPEPTDPTEPVKTYELDLKHNGSGTVKYVDGKTEAAAGESIFFYAIPNEGYFFERVGIFNPDGAIDVSTVRLIEHGDDLYEIIMIPHDLIITCYFSPIV